MVLFSGVELPHLEKAEQRRRVVCSNAVEKDGIVERVGSEPLKTENLACSI